MAELEYKYVVSSPVLYKTTGDAAGTPAGLFTDFLSECLALPWVKTEGICKMVENKKQCSPKKDPITGAEIDFHWKKLVDKDANDIVGVYASGQSMVKGVTLPSLSSATPALVGIMSLGAGIKGADIFSPTLGVKAKVVNAINQVNKYNIQKAYKAVGFHSAQNQYINIPIQGSFTKSLPLVSMLQTAALEGELGDDTAKEHYNSYTRILDLMLNQTIKSYLL